MSRQLAAHTQRFADINKTREPKQAHAFELLHTDAQKDRERHRDGQTDKETN